MIPLCSPKTDNLRYRRELKRAFEKTVNSGRYILGDNVAAFEREFAAHLKTRFAVGVASGTDALLLALKACDIGPGDEVITVSHTAVATVAAIEMAGAKPVFVDIDEWMTLDPWKIEAAISAKTKAILPVHLYGQPADMEAISKIARRRGLFVIEDCAQAFGSFYGGRAAGTLGDIGCFSFYPTKNLGAIGDGGMVVTKSQRLAQRLRLLRQYGWKQRYISSSPGWNSRLDELQAAFLRIKLRRAKKTNAARQRVAGIYGRELAGTGLRLPDARPQAQHAYHLYVIRTSQRSALRKLLTRNGIETAIHYPQPVHAQPAYAHRIKNRSRLRWTEQAAAEVLSLPMHAGLSDVQIRAVVKTIQKFGKAT